LYAHWPYIEVLSPPRQLNCLGEKAIPTSLALLRAGSFVASLLRMTIRKAASNVVGKCKRSTSFR